MIENTRREEGIAWANIIKAWLDTHDPQIKFLKKKTHSDQKEDYWCKIPKIKDWVKGTCVTHIEYKLSRHQFFPKQIFTWLDIRGSIIIL